MRQPLDHSACLPDEVTPGRWTDYQTRRGAPFPPLEKVYADYVKDNLDLVCQPGKVSNYANAHYLMLARIIEEVSGEPYDT